MIDDAILKYAINIIKSSNITYTEFTKYYQPNYSIVNNIWKSYRFFNKLPFNMDPIFKFFKFHLKLPKNHGIMYYANNSDKASMTQSAGVPEQPHALIPC